MGIQKVLFDEALRAHPNAVARATDPSTSHEAAKSLGDLTPLRRKVLDVVCAIGPATHEQLVDEYALQHGPVSPSTVRTRVKELERAGFVLAVEDGSKTRSGRPCRSYIGVWDPVWPSQRTPQPGDGVLYRGLYEELLDALDDLLEAGAVEDDFAALVDEHRKNL